MKADIMGGLSVQDIHVKAKPSNKLFCYRYTSGKSFVSTA